MSLHSPKALVGKPPVAPQQVVSCHSRRHGRGQSRARAFLAFLTSSAAMAISSKSSAKPTT